MTLIMIHGLKKTTSIMVSSIFLSKNCLKCSIRIFALWNWEKNRRHFTRV